MPFRQTGIKQLFLAIRWLYTNPVIFLAEMFSKESLTSLKKVRETYVLYCELDRDFVGRI